MTDRAGAPVDPVLLARALRQWSEMGLPALFLDQLDRSQAVSLASASAAAPVAPVLPSIPDEVGTPRPSTVEETAAAPVEAPAPAPTPVDDFDDEALREAVRGCTLCALHQTRKQTVYADGAPDARVMVVGEAPGAHEDATGLPFVGEAGRLLDLMLAAIDLSRRDSVYICNVLKCRPPGNRNPQPDEIASCSPYLRRQIELVRPEAILAVGSFAARLLTGSGDTASLGSLRGTVHSYEGVPLVVTYHPAALLRNRTWSRPAWDDLQLLRRVMEAA